MLTVSSLCKSFGTQIVVQDVSMQVSKGEIVALLGPSGCGKTTTLRMIAGFVQPDRGRIDVDGRPLAGKRPYERNVGIVFQDYALFPHMTVERNVAYGPVRRGLKRSAVAERVRRYLELVRMADYHDRSPLSLSGGQQQRVALARALATEPEVLLLDEPLSALDAKLRVEIRGELREILLAAGCATIVVTHDQDEAMSLADRIYVMNAGRIAQSGTPEDVYRRPADAFVASFVGRSNLFRGLLKPEGKAYRFEGEDGCSFAWQLPCARPGAVCFAVRPERLRLETVEPASAGPELSGTVVRRLYLGQDEELTIALASGRCVSAIARAGTGPALRARVTLRFDPVDIMPLARDKQEGDAP